MGYLDSFFTSADGVFAKIRTTQRTAIERAAEAIAASLGNPGPLTGYMGKAITGCGPKMMLTSCGGNSLIFAMPVGIHAWMSVTRIARAPRSCRSSISS